MHSTRTRSVGASIAVAVTPGFGAYAQQAPPAGSTAQSGSPASSATAPAGASDADLAKQLSNPIADLVSIPFQFNWEQGVGYQDATRTVLNVQPVVTFAISDNWNLIGRWIMPFVSQPSLSPGQGPVYGLSDIVFSAFFAPRATKSGLIWGVGPAVSLPMTDDPLLGSGKWSAGPTASCSRSRAIGRTVS